MRRDLRMRSTALFTEVYDKGKRIGEKNLVLFFRDNGKPTTRVGFSVSKKVGKAVTRNKIKRRLRNIVWAYEDRLESGHDLVFIARAPAVTASFVDLGKSAGRLLRKAEILKEHP